MKTIDSLTFIAKNETMREMIARIDKIVDSDSSVLLIGETGVGKEIIAEYIHRTSSRGQGPFVKLGLSAMPADLLESELFGVNNFINTGNHLPHCFVFCYEC